MAYCKMVQTDKGIRYMSGMLVYDERVVAGRPVMGYLNAAGQIWNEQHLTDDKYLPTGGGFKPERSLQSFRLTVNGRKLEKGWSIGQRKTEETTASMELLHEDAPVKVELLTEAKGGDWLARSLSVTNISDQWITLDEVCPLAGAPWLHTLDNGLHTYSFQELEDDPGKPFFEAGLNIASEWGQEGDLRFLPISKEKIVYDAARNGRSGWSRPAVLLRDNLNGAVLCAELAYSGNWITKMEANLHPGKTYVDFELGLCCPEGQALRVLAPGESIETPQVHFTLCASGLDALTQSRHRYVRECIMPPNDPIGGCLVEANHRGYLSDRENEEEILLDVEIAAEAGVELYVIDAGWYGREPNVWFDNVGDWYAAPWLPNDLYPIIDRAHAKGMKFGLWMELEAVGRNAKLREEHPDFIMRNGSDEIAGGRVLDLSKPEVADWVEEEVESLISRYQLDMFRIDHNHRIGDGACRQVGSYLENVLWRYFENFYAMLERLRNKFPKVSFQNCAGGGGRMDFGILRYFHHSELSDWMHAPRVHRIFQGTMAQLPPETLLQCMGTEVCEQVMKGDLLFQIHSVLGSRFILRGIAPSMGQRNPELHRQICEAIELYQTKLRPVLTENCLVYQHTRPDQGIFYPEPWLAYELSRPDRKAGYALIFRLADEGNQEYIICPKGISRNKNYLVTLDRAGDSFCMDGFHLSEKGITIRAEKHFFSELIYWEECENA